MLSISDLKKGTVIVIDNEPHQVLFSQLSKKGRAGSVLSTKLKNLVRGTVMERNFKQSDKFPEADIDEVFAEYLYYDDEGYHFMDTQTYEQYDLSAEIITDHTQKFLQDQLQVKITFYQDDPIDIELPSKVILPVTQAPPGAKGNTVDAAQKTVVTETGLEVSAPMFIHEGDSIKVNTETGQYEEKVSTH